MLWYGMVWYGMVCAIRAFGERPGIFIMTNPSSRQRGCYIRTMTARVQLEKKMSGRESQEAWRQDELIGGKPPVVTLTLALVDSVVPAWRRVRIPPP
jgi:hypothetical protein